MTASTASPDTGPISALYLGRVTHARLQPIRHRFAYRMAALYVDLAELPALDRRLRLFSHDRFNVFSFHTRDHGPRDGRPLRPWIDARLAEAGIDLDGGPVRLLCFPRLWGYVFNPLTVWFCHHRDGRLLAVNYEVSNTFGQHHHYLIPVAEGETPGQPLRQACAKGFHVSPFLPMQGDYAFRLRAPAARLSLSIRLRGSAGDLLLATQTGRRRPLSDRNLLRTLTRHPLMTAKVTAAIHWQAWKLWRRGASFRRRPPAPAQQTTIVQPTQEAAE